jgi:hypothetical protein
LACIHKPGFTAWLIADSHVGKSAGSFISEIHGLIHGWVELAVLAASEAANLATSSSRDADSTAWPSVFLAASIHVLSAERTAPLLNLDPPWLGRLALAVAVAIIRLMDRSSSLVRCIVDVRISGPLVSIDAAPL